MIRGFIESVTAESVSGWMFAEFIGLRGHKVLAFLDRECIGVGRIERFRQDLADAGLGDGFLGFHFGIAPRVTPQDQPRVMVRLEGSDVVLLQAGARVVGTGTATAVASDSDVPAIPPEASLRWMLARGWLSEEEYDVLRLLDRFGVHSFTLPTSGVQAGVDLLDRVAAARALFELYAMDAVAVERVTLPSLDDLPGQWGRPAAAEGGGEPPPPLPILALWSPMQGRIGVAEASHRSAASVRHGAEALVDYVYGPNRLLLLHQNCRFVPRIRATSPSGCGEVLEIFTATRAPVRGRAARLLELGR